MRLTIAVLFLMGAVPLAKAQEAWLSATTAHSQYALFSRPAGVAGGLTLPVKGPLAFRVTYDLLDDKTSRLDRACAGLIPPGEVCPEEPVDNTTSLRGLTFGLVASIKQWGRARLTLTPTVSAVTMRTTLRGRQTGNALSSSTEMIGFGGGAELSYRPSSTSPFTLHVGGHVSLLGNVGATPVDGYSPFNDAMRLMRLDIGASVGRRPRP